jgi:murein L,D-transpeptidase YafK
LGTGPIPHKVTVVRLFASIGLFVAVILTVSCVTNRDALRQQHVAKVLVLKAQHKLLLLGDDNNVLRTYSVAIGRGGLQPKERQGDHKTPE